MHVLLDARCILGAKTGDRSYWLGLLSALPRVAADWRFTAALDAEPPPGLLPDRPNLEIAIAPTPRGRLWSLIALPRLAARLKVDLVHLQYVGPPRLSCPLVTTIHDCSFALFPETFPRRDGLWLRQLAPWTARRAAAVIGDTETTRQDLVRLWGLDPAKVFAPLLGIGEQYRPAAPAAVTASRAKYDLPEVYLLSVGVLQPRKNLPGLLTAYALARREHGVAAPLVVVGKRGWLYEQTFRTVAELGLTDTVRFVGYVPDEDLPALYTGAAMLLYPSLYEGFGLPPVEAMACGAPAVVSTAAALVEVTGDAALHLPPDDPAAWAATIARLLCDDAERSALAERGRSRAAELTWDRSAREHLVAYRYASAGSRGG